ncbi:hypothetical protein DLM85_03370 [Hymenobacter edaphi]|uniref:Uncharacterized protein n=2 Tax=Hymenobacter edaphi TaxID=2211146 RepID=A0A328BXS1_9BACT|nr:hypothetical protein DLM85_03370 [Hymenobacter edaphi]
MRLVIRDYNPEWKPLLLPQKHLLARKFTTGRRHTRSAFLATVQLRIEYLLDSARLREPTNLICNEPRLQRELTAQGSTATLPGQAVHQVVFAEETVLPTSPDQRILGVTLTDQGEGALVRYSVCARYSSTDGKAYVAVVPSDNECPPQAGYATVTVPMARLERSLFVEKLLMAFQLNNLMVLDGPAQLLRRKLQQQISRSLQLQSSSLRLSDSVLTYTLQQQEQLDALTAARREAKADSLQRATQLGNQTFDELKARQPKVAEELQAAEISAKQLKSNVDAAQKQRRNTSRKAQSAGPSIAELQTLEAQYRAAQEKASVLRQEKQKLQRFFDALTTRRQQVAQLLQKYNITTASLGRATLTTNQNEKELRAVQDTIVQQEARLRKASVGAKLPADAAAASALLTISPSANTAPTSTLRSALTDMYLELAQQQIVFLAAPQAGTLDVLDEANVYVPNVTRPHWRFRPDVVSIEIEDGMVLGLKATGHRCLDNQKVVFESRAPVGISADRDLYQEWHHQRLWLQYPLHEHGPHQASFVRLTDVLRYYPNLAPQAGDRSPADGVYVVHPGDPLPQRTFTKIATQKILQGRLYTDLAGVKSENPNGLVQLEISRKFVFGAPWSKFSPNLQLQVFGYFTPFVSVNKLEQQNRYLPLQRTEQRGRYIVQTIDLVRYTNFRVGGDYNLVGLRLPRFKSDFGLDLGFALQRVAIRDTLTRIGRPTVANRPTLDSTLNVGSYGVSLKARIRPDSRYGLMVRLGYFRYTLLNDRDNQPFIDQQPQARDVGRDGRTTFGEFAQRYWYEGVIQYEMTGRLRIAENLEYFVRPQLSHLLYRSSRTFFQIQTGFQFDVFGPKREAPPGVIAPDPIQRRSGLR